ncbi:DNA repair protein RecN [Flagellimonas allohymeniacidonis]|uniref:DNA repair protein RecN n=1 Tax=Flagellimonas allohymeniacidonis TaxID=2517819 RepID=A0A4Q8QF17_9FLAO|nr:DNA repair protein RecN [Allomuricauda hymeniacidonis]TAI49065.1 DNA repair protein RecN [Allomuricauda hymeniacidonis]
MLVHLSIKNYALINDINVAFSDRFTTITGETGAGKSILLGALSLALGKRADLSSLKEMDKKCIIEAEFDVSKYRLKRFFSSNDLDYEDTTLLRREILPSGKSRAFVNDSPVNLDVLKRLGELLVDVHSQHQTLLLTENDFQMKVVDALARNDKKLESYRAALVDYKHALTELKELQESQANAIKEHDYNSFLFKELEAAQLQPGVQEEWESEYEQLNNVEQILEKLSQGHQLMNGEPMGVLASLAELKRTLQNLEAFGSAYAALSERVQSVLIETDDIASELEVLQDSVEANPQRLEVVNGQLQQLYALQKKHQTDSVEELLKIKDDLAAKVEVVENMEAQLQQKQEAVEKTEKALEHYAVDLSEGRRSVLSKLKSLLQEKLMHLGMPAATFQIEINPSQNYKSNGKDDLTFLFSANKGSNYGELKKVASGGELSRIMLTIKSILSQYEQLPTLIFDEIDTGVSGEISNRMGEIMLEMSKTMQVLSITHLPQVASKGKHQFKVFKEEQNGVASTQMKQLTEEERVAELAEMLGGKSLSESAVAHAKELLNQA